MDNYMKGIPRSPKSAPRKGLRRGMPGEGVTVLLISMPWQPLNQPSIQLGTLQSVLQRAGIRVGVRSAWLAFMEHCLAETSQLPDQEQIQLRDYQAVFEGSYTVSLGDWIFAVPPFRESTETDSAYLSFLRERGMPEPEIARALTFRRLVPAFLKDCVAEIQAVAPRVVGFTSSYSQNVPSLVLAKLLKRHQPSVKVVFGGANCEGPMGAALHRAFPWVDVVVRGEAERVLPEVMHDLLDGRPVRPQPGLCFREGHRAIAIDSARAAPISMDEVPLPIFDEYFKSLDKTSFRAHLKSDVHLLYESARGCWYGAKTHCTFCGINDATIAFRSKSPERVVKELTGLARRYRRLDFEVVDNIMDLRYLREVLPRIRESGYDLSLFCEMKANLKRDEVRLLREAGLDRIQPGIESLSTPILRLMRKGVTAFQNVRLLKWCAQFGIRVRWNAIYGFPGETPEEYARMAEVVPSLAHLEPPNLSPLGVERFSPYHEQPHAFGLELLGPLPWYRLIYPVEAATLTDLAYAFAYRHADGRDPEAYVGPLRQAIATWRANQAAGYRSLRYRRGPGFLIICDRRPNLEPADYSFGEREARLYLACEDGATPVQVSEALRSSGIGDVDPDDARAYLDALVPMRLVYKENNYYLALALPAVLPEAGRYAVGENASTGRDSSKTT